MKASLRISLLGLLLVMISLFLMGICILNDGAVCGGIVLAVLIVGTLVTLLGLLWDIRL
jgi:hypothetical protein